MATYTASFTIDPTDQGNIPTYLFYTNLSNSSGSLTQDTLDNVMTELMNALPTGFSYSITGDGDWLGNTTVTLSYTGNEVPIFVLLQTESFTYPVGFTAITECVGAYELTLTACQSNYVIPSGLIPSSTYYFAIETNRNKRYVQSVSTNVDGDVQLWSAAPEFPEGFFTPEMYTYSCKAYTDSALTNQVQFTIDNVVYNTINLKFIYTIIVSD